MEELCQYYIKKKGFIVFVIFIGIFASVVYNFLREDIYESKMTVKIESAGGVVQIQNIVYDINQKIMLKPIHGEEGVLGEDYSDLNVYVNDRNKNGWIDIYVHGRTPEEAKANCEGVYEHIKYYSEHYKKSILEQANNSADVVAAKNMADEAFKGVLSSNDTISLNNGLYNMGGKNISPEENEFFRKEFLYRSLLENEVRELFKRSCDYTVAVPPNVPEHPVSKKYPIVIVGSFVVSMSVAIILLFISFLIKRTMKSNI